VTLPASTIIEMNKVTAEMDRRVIRGWMWGEQGVSNHVLQRNNANISKKI